MGPGDSRRPEAGVDELEACLAALAQADPQFEERAHALRLCRRVARASYTETASDKTAMTVAQIATTPLAFIS
jgi:hypothetical protein